MRTRRVSRGWSISRIAEESGVSRSTIFRWQRGDSKQDPLPAQVVAFCDALAIPPGTAFAILWPGKGERAPQPEPMPLDRDFELLLRRLADPAVSDAEKYLIRETVKALANRNVARRIEGRRDVG
jgi:transcriptional regulator with XRE-family HTH domain